jgi:acetyl esterase/lipase
LSSRAVTDARSPTATAASTKETRCTVYFLRCGVAHQYCLPPRSAAAAPDEAPSLVENDVLRDEGEAYARKLTAAGVTVTSTRYNGTFHDFVMLNVLADTPAARAAIAQARAFLRNAFVQR